MIHHGVALVTGGGTGIGAATARWLAADGYAVAVTGRRREPLEALAAEIDCLALPGDAADPSAAGAAVAATVERFGRLDAVVLNAGGGGAPGSLLDVDPAAFVEVHRVNVVGALTTAQAALGALLEHRGAIVAVSSVAGLRAAPDSVAYCSSKAALVMLAQCIALDFGPAGVRANAVCPGWTRSPMGDRAMDESRGGAGRRPRERVCRRDPSRAAPPAGRPGRGRRGDRLAAVSRCVVRQRRGAHRRRR